MAAAPATRTRAAPATSTAMPPSATSTTPRAGSVSSPVRGSAGGQRQCVQLVAEAHQSAVAGGGSLTSVS